MMDIAVIGTGYVGLVSGVCLAEKGHRVICVDNDDAKVARIARGESPIFEAGLDELLRRNIGDRLHVTTDLAEAIAASEASLIAVGTPFDGERIDLRAVETVALEIGAALKHKDDFHTVVVKSTVVPGTTDGIVRRALEQASEKRAGVDFGLGMNPEFLKEGEAIADFMAPDRIVLGGVDDRTLEVMDRIYAVFENVDVLRTGNSTAEMIKYASNALLATLISFANEMGNLCADIGGIDAMDVMRGVHLDRRVSPILADGQRIVPSVTTYLKAGCGFGGSCFPKDVKALIAHGKSAGVPMPLLESVMSVNAAQPNRVMAMLEKNLNLDAETTVSVLGLAFKPGTDDMRESPAIPVLRRLLDHGVRIKAYDPVAMESARKLLDSADIEYCTDIATTIEGADAVLLMTAWSEFELIPDLVRTRKEQPLIVDGRRLLARNSVSRYEGIGVS